MDRALEDAMHRGTQRLINDALDEVKEGIRRGAASAMVDVNGTKNGLIFNMDSPHVNAAIDKRLDFFIGSIHDTSKARIMGIMERMGAEGATQAQVGKAVRAEIRSWHTSKGGAETRADLIAFTELGEGYEMGRWLVIEQGEQLGLQMEKRWILVSDERTCEICEIAVEDWIPVRSNFANGFPAPLAHPACRCDMVLREVPGTARAGATGDIKVSQKNPNDIGGIQATEDAMRRHIANSLGRKTTESGWRSTDWWEDADRWDGYAAYDTRTGEIMINKHWWKKQDVVARWSTRHHEMLHSFRDNRGWTQNVTQSFINSSIDEGVTEYLAKHLAADFMKANRIGTKKAINELLLGKSNKAGYKSYIHEQEVLSKIAAKLGENELQFMREIFLQPHKEGYKFIMKKAKKKKVGKEVADLLLELF